MGPIKLAQMTGAPIGAFHLQPERAWTMRSWDRFLIPKPFTRICVSWARWTQVPADLPADQFEPKREELNAAIERARLRALEHFKKAKDMSEGKQPTGLRVDDFDFELPAELIAQQPPAERGQSRMLVMDRATGALRDARFSDLPSLLAPGDLLVLNDSRVIPARLYARRTLREREKPTGRIEVMLTEPAGENLWRALVGRGRKSPSASGSSFQRPGEIALEAEVLERGEFGERLLRFEAGRRFLCRAGSHWPHAAAALHSPRRRRRGSRALPDRFSRERGSVAAPTAGLHFTPQMLERWRKGR
jgi:hypothetical protein